MFEWLSCPHGVHGPWHLIVDMWWIFVLCVPGVPWLLSKMGVIVRKCFCCQHSEAEKNVKCCDHTCEEKK